MSTSDTKIIKVMIVDDHPIVRNGLEASLLADKRFRAFRDGKERGRSASPLQGIDTRCDFDGLGHARHGWP